MKTFFDFGLEYGTNSEDVQLFFIMHEYQKNSIL